MHADDAFDLIFGRTLFNRSKQILRTPTGVRTVKSSLGEPSPNNPHRKKEVIIMRKGIKKQFWFSKDDADDLRHKAECACMSEAALIRLLLRGYHPKEKPDRSFFDAMNKLSLISSNINQLAKKANSLNFIDAPMLYREAEAWQRFRADLERRFIRPDKSDLKWQ